MQQFLTCWALIPMIVGNARLIELNSIWSLFFVMDLINPFPCVIHRFYIEKISFLKENTTVELFFLNAKSAVYNVSSIHTLIGCFVG